MLRKEAKEVPKSDISKKEFQSFLDNMFSTMKKDRGVGLAAPQVGLSTKVFVVDMNMSDHYDDVDEVPQNVFINPRITSTYGDEMVGLEGCLSLPDIYGEVPRSSCVEVEAFDREGKKFKLDVCGLYARVIQHEYDHLEGVLFIDRVRDLKTLRIEK